MVSRRGLLFGGASMKRRVFMALLGGAIAAPSVGYAERPAGRVPVVGVIVSERIKAALLQGLRDAGYDAGTDLTIESRPAIPAERLPQFAAELVALDPDVIVASGTQAVRAAQQATHRIPIVMTGTSDPVGTGLVISLARPGGNTTGLSLMNPELSGKRLELLKEMVGAIASVAVLCNPDDPSAAPSLRETEDAGRLLSINVQIIAIRRVEDFNSAFDSIADMHPKAAVVLSSPTITQNAYRIAAWALEHRLPAVSWEKGFPSSGGLMSYGPDLDGLAGRAAVYVDKILKGTKPADLPVEQPTKFELVINLKTAKALGLTVPQSLLARADQVIE
jgi:putative tryptophan/tyrosine transport system substrate-binding protein